MKRNTYFYMITGHVNLARKIYQGIILSLSHWPSLMVAVFLRKNMGERYFTLSACLTYALLLLIPAALKAQFEYLSFLEHFNWGWTVFICVFIGFSIIRRLEFKRNSHVVRTDRFSYYDGDMMWPLWQQIEKTVPFLKADPLLIQKYYEPLLVLIAAFLSGFIFYGSYVAILLFFTAILQFLRVQVQYSKGRNFIMDKIDEIIANEELANSLINDKPVEETKGFKFFGPKPESREVREKLIDLIIIDDRKEAFEVD